MSARIRRAARTLGVSEGEARIVGLSVLMFFVLMGGYFLVRPVRDAMGIAGGVRQLENLIFVTAGAMLLAAPVYAWTVRRLERRRFVALAMRLFALVLLGFFGVFLLTGASGESAVWPGRVFYVWVSVYNLFIVSIFWSVMADCFALESSKRLFGLISIGGTIGAFAGSAVMGTLGDAAPIMGVEVAVWAMLVSAGSLEIASRCFRAIDRRRPAHDEHEHDPITPSLWSGITSTLRSRYLLGICAYITLSSMVWTLLYIEQGRIIEAHVEGEGSRIAVFARIDVAYNAIALFLQLFVAGHMMKRLGVGFALGLLPAIAAVGFLMLPLLGVRDGLLLGYAPVIWGLLAFQVVRRAVQYGLNKPARSTLFTVVNRDERYKAKCFIDTYVYRTGDAAGAGLSRWLASGVGGLPYVAAGLACVWMVVGLVLGAQQRRLAHTRIEPDWDGAPSGVVPATVPLASAERA